jgi:hypothetical protein
MFGTAKAFNLRPHGELRLLYEKSFDIIKKRLTQNKINESNQSTLVWQSWFCCLYMIH